MPEQHAVATTVEDPGTVVAIDTALDGLERAIVLVPPADVQWRGRLVTLRRLLAEEAGRRPVGLA
jgi:hypothetical protein